MSSSHLSLDLRCRTNASTAATGNTSVGNLTTDDRVALFFMHYPGKTRLKLFGRARIIGRDERTVLERLTMPDYRDRIERGIVVTVEGFDWNCAQHITERYTLVEVQAATAALTGRIAELEAELTGCRFG